MRPSLGVYRTVAVVPGQPQSNDVLFSVRKRGQPATITGLAIAETPPWSIGERPDPFNPYAGTKTCRVGGTIEPGGSCGVRVVFAPPTTGTFKGMLTLNTSAGSVDVRLRGEGIPFRPVPQPPILTPASFCANQPNGTPCNADSNGCTLDTCQSGSCTVGSAPNCDDVYTCTTDTCNSTGNNTYTCAHTTNANTCLIGSTCYAENAANPSNQCQQCTSASSQTAFSNKPDTTVCDDTEVCTQTDTCQGGVCTGSNPLADGTTCDAGVDGSPPLTCASGVCGACAADALATPQFVDNGNGTITDRATCLVWEKKDDDNAVGSLHDKDNFYQWACAEAGTLCQPTAAAATACAGATGSALGCAQCASTSCNTIWTWQVALNASGFAGHQDWRVPTSAGCCGLPTGEAAEIESIVDLAAR